MSEKEVPYFIKAFDSEEAHRAITNQVLEEIGKEEANRLFKYEELDESGNLIAFCEVDYEFVAFLDVYADLKDRVPKDFVIIDLGCNQGFQGALFKEHAAYIGVDIGVGKEGFLRQDNASFYHSTIQDFIETILPTLGLDLNKVFAVCSYVPDTEARAMVRQTFPFHRDYYVGEPWSEKIPDDSVKERPKSKPLNKLEPEL